MLYHLTLGITPLVNMDSSWKTIMHNKVIVQNFGRSESSLVSSWGGLSVMYVMVC